MELSEIVKGIDPNGTLFTWSLAGTIFGIAAVTMAFVQVVKELLPLRWAFQQYWIWRWFFVRGQKFRLSTMPEESKGGTRLPAGRLSSLRRLLDILWPVTKNLWSAILYVVSLKFIWEADDLSDEAWSALIDLAAGGRKRSLFRLPTAQLVAQMGAAGQIVLEYPNKYEKILKVLSQGADVDDLDLYLKQSPDSEASSRSKTAAARVKRREEPPSQDYLDARNRIAHRIQRNLDAIHIAMAGDWKLFMLILAYAVSLVLAGVTVYATAAASGSRHPLLISLFVGVTGGYAASVISDTISVIHSLRRP